MTVSDICDGVICDDGGDVNKNVSRFFKDYKQWDDGGEYDQIIISDARKVYNALKTPRAIQSAFGNRNFKDRYSAVPGLSDMHDTNSLYCVYMCALQYAMYHEKCDAQMSKNLQTAIKTIRKRTTRTMTPCKNER